MLQILLEVCRWIKLDFYVNWILESIKYFASYNYEKKSYPINSYTTQIFEKYNARNDRMKTFFPLRHRLKSSISHIFASNISFHVLPLFLVARFSILSSSQACLLSLFSCKVYCLLSATKNEQRFFYSKFHIISLLDFSFAYILSFILFRKKMYL